MLHATVEEHLGLVYTCSSLKPDLGEDEKCYPDE